MNQVLRGVGAMMVAPKQFRTAIYLLCHDVRLAVRLSVPAEGTRLIDGRLSLTNYVIDLGMMVSHSKIAGKGKW